MSIPYDVACDAGDLCGEAPLWLEDRRTLIWADQGRGLVRRLRNGTHHVIAAGFAAGGLAQAEDGSVVLAGPGGLARLSEGLPLERLPLAPLGRGCLNDVVAGPGGELLAGRMVLTPDASNVAGPGSLMAIAGNGDVRVLDDDVLLPNGMGLSPDGESLYLVDSARRQILVYATADLRRRGPMHRRVLVTLREDDGFPDGLAVDVEGGIWVALWYGGQILRLSPSGQQELRIGLPFRQVSSLAFGGPDRRDLYVTTAGTPWLSVFAPPGWAANGNLQGGPLVRIPVDVPGAARRRIKLRPSRDLQT